MCIERQIITVKNNVHSSKEMPCADQANVATSFHPASQLAFSDGCNYLVVVIVAIFHCQLFHQRFHVQVFLLDANTEVENSGKTEREF